MAENKSPEAVKPISKSMNFNFDMPEAVNFLEAGVQFGHQTKRWNPKMSKYIYADRAGLHIIDVGQTFEELVKALKFLVEASSRGTVLFVGTKRQARDIIKDMAVDAGAYFIIHRWVGGLLTNFNYTRRSLKKLITLEEAFEAGIEGRTKFEISRMKKEWERLNRLYEGVKSMESKPTAVVVLDAKYEKNAVREARLVGVPVVAIVDTNCDPDIVNYPVPGNDDAISSIQLLFSLFAKAVKQGNNTKGVKHVFTDYSKYEVEIRKSDKDELTKYPDEMTEEQEAIITKVESVQAKKPTGEGILERVQKAKEEQGRQNEQIAKKPKKKEVSDRVKSALKDAKIKLSEAKKMKKEDLLEIKGIGPKGVEEIKNS